MTIEKEFIIDKGNMVNMSCFALDIETVPLKIQNADVIEYLMDKKFNRGVHPVFSKIIIIGMKEEDKDYKLFYGDDERKILEDFWHFFHEEQPEKIITFNGYQFDIPFIHVRTFVNGIKTIPTVGINRNKWRMEQSNHFDLMFAFSGMDNFQWVSLETLCRMNEIEVPKNRTRLDQMIEFHREGKWEPLIEHNKQCLMMIEALFKKVFL